MLAVIGVGAPVAGGTPPTDPSGPFYVQSGSDGFTFTAGYSGAFSLPATFPTGIVKVTGTINYTTSNDLALFLSGHLPYAFSLISCGGSPVTGTLVCSWEAWGW